MTMKTKIDFGRNKNAVSEILQPMLSRFLPKAIDPVYVSPQKITIDQSELVPKIDNQIASNQKKIEAISGSYQTNTRKRMGEEQTRENTREGLRFEISILENFKAKAMNNELTDLEQALINTTLRADFKAYERSMYQHKQTITYPEITSETRGWYVDEIPKIQKRLNKAGIQDTQQLIAAVESFHAIIAESVNPIDPTRQKVKKLESEAKFSHIAGYFPTPNAIVRQMIELAGIHSGACILEPSAGNGNILDGLKAYMQEEGISCGLRAIERSSTLREILTLKGYNIVDDDFLEHDQFDCYDYILMNPPFEKCQDILHVQHAYKCLRPGGRIVAIMSPHFSYGMDAKSVLFREWIDGKGSYEKLPEGAFKESGTGVSTFIVVIDRKE